MLVELYNTQINIKCWYTKQYTIPDNFIKWKYLIFPFQIRDQATLSIHFSEFPSNQQLSIYQPVTITSPLHLPLFLSKTLYNR